MRLLQSLARCALRLRNAGRVASVAIIPAVLATGATASDVLPFKGAVRIYAGFAAGGQSDILARILADELRQSLDRPVLVENKTGAGGRIALESLKSAAADGSVLALGNTAQLGVAPLIYKDLGYDPLTDFAPVIKLVDYQIAAAAGPGTADLATVLAAVRAAPAKAGSGIPGNGSLPHLYGLKLATASGTPLTQVAYRGGAPILAALSQGEIVLGWGGVADFLEGHRSGLVRIVAVSGESRSPLLPEVGTFSQQGYAGLPNGWIGLFAPAAIDPAAQEHLRRHLASALADPRIAERLQAFGFTVAASGPKELKAEIEADLARWRPIVAEAGLRP